MVDPEHVAHDVTDLALGGVGLDCLENRRDQVLVARRSLAHALEGLRHQRLVAIRADTHELSDLLLLGFLAELEHLD